MGIYYRRLSTYVFILSRIILKSYFLFTFSTSHFFTFRFTTLCFFFIMIGKEGERKFPMTISIGIITARNSLENIQALDSEMQKFGKISYLPYRTMPELCSLYTKNLRKFDGILFSGPIPRDYIIENIGPIVIPCRCIDLKDRDYYLTIARLYANNPGLDITRVYFDMIIDPYIFKNIFPEGTGPRFPTNFSSPQYRNLLRSSVYESSLNSYRDLWKNGTFDIFVTRYTNLTSRLHAEKIPHILLKPTPETILDCFHSLLGDVHTYFLHNALTACCIIEAEETESMSEHHRRMEKVLEEFRNSHNNDIDRKSVV